MRDVGEFRIRHDRVDGRGLKGTKVILLVDDRSVRVLDAEGEFLAKFEIDPRLIYQAKV